MKIRIGFVSNSSSSSFVVSKRYLSADQIDKIKKHIEYAKENFPQISWADPEQKWDIEETEEQIIMSTFMDNFDIEEFLLAIGIEDKHIKCLPY